MPDQILSVAISDTLNLEMILVEGGIFEMGNAISVHEDEKPVHSVELGSFYMSKYLVTQEVWQAVMGNHPSNFKGARRPVELVSWEDTQDFISALNSRDKDNSFLFRLPTEAEWEYAARGGALSKGYQYAGSDKLRQVGWYTENSEEGTKEIGQLYPNELGLYDMSGNVDEWCEDCFSEEYYTLCHQQGLVENPCNSTAGTNRVVRGGSYFDGAADCRCTIRFGNGPGYRSVNIGFRLVGVLQSVG